MMVQLHRLPNGLEAQCARVSCADRMPTRFRLRTPTRSHPAARQHQDGEVDPSAGRAGSVVLLEAASEAGMVDRRRDSSDD
jgi:hypothetical protein